jgi:hypothetical protein
VADLVLQTRVSVARQNLKRLTGLQAMVDRRDERVADFLELPGALRSQIAELHRLVLRLKGLDLPLGTPQELTDGLDCLELELKAARQNLGMQADKVGRVRDEFSQLTQDRQDVDDYLVKGADELERELTTDNYWSKRDKCEAMFSEYVDYLRGVAIRSTGFGDEDFRLSDLFLLADNLPAVWGRPGGWTWKSLAIPSRAEENASTQAYVLRIGFPEWTIWALPLLQHEFGRVVTAKNERDLPVSSPTEAAMLADALAGLVTGPAYACAELLLRLDPASVNRWDDEVTLRSATILKSLALSAQLAGDAALTGLAARLETEWRDAVESAGGAATALDTALEKSAVTLVIERAARFLGLGDWADDQPQVPPWADRWATVVTWSGHLASQQPDQIDIGEVDAQNGALALLLDAAWLARVGPSPAADANPGDLDAVAVATIGRMLDAVRASRWPMGLAGSRTAKG